MLSVPISRFLLLRPWLLLGSSQIFLLKHLPYFCPEADKKGKTLPCWTRECWPHDKTPKEITDIKNNPIESITVDPQEDNLFEWKCTIKGAADSPYKGGTFCFNVSLPSNYPFKAPTVTFTTRIYHPGINEEGAICVPVLRDEWKPTVTLLSVLLTIKEKVNNPSTDDPFEPDIAAVLKNDKYKFSQTVKEWIKKYAST